MLGDRDAMRRSEPAAGEGAPGRRPEERTIHQVMPDGRIVGEIRSDTPVFVISVAAELAGMHAQTLRSYDREGLVSPGRTSGGGRRYSQRDIELLQQVQRLSQDEGVNRAGIRRIIELESQVDDLADRIADLQQELARVRAQLATERSDTPGTAPSHAQMVARRADVQQWRSATTAIVTWRRR